MSLSSFERTSFFQLNMWSSDDGKEVTPVPIPNTEVKLFSADGSWGLPPVRVGRRFAHVKPTEKSVGFLFVYIYSLFKKRGQSLLCKDNYNEIREQVLIIEL